MKVHIERQYDNSNAIESHGEEVDLLLMVPRAMLSPADN